MDTVQNGRAERIPSGVFLHSQRYPSLLLCHTGNDHGRPTGDARTLLAIKPLIPVFSRPVFSPLVDCHPVQIRIDCWEETGKQTGDNLPPMSRKWIRIRTVRQATLTKTCEWRNSWATGSTLFSRDSPFRRLTTVPHFSVIPYDSAKHLRVSFGYGWKGAIPVQNPVALFLAHILHSSTS